MPNEHNNKDKHGDWGPAEVKEILDTLADKVPGLLEALSDVLYSKENAVKYGDAIAHFYKSLLEAGMSQDQAYALTEKYMSSLSPLSAVGGMFGGKGPHLRGDWEKDDD